MQIFFRADGDSQYGLGHVIRSLSVAQMIAGDFECFFLSRNPIPEIASQIRNHCQLIEIDDSITQSLEINWIRSKFIDQSSIMVLDGYKFDTNYQVSIKKSGCKLICIDDIHSYHFVADAVINHALCAKKELYSYEDYTLFYLGLEYAMLRNCFQKNAKERNSQSYTSNKNVFISMGGADPKNDILNVLKELVARKDNLNYHYHIVLGPAYLFYENLMNFNFEESIQISFYRNLSETEMFNLMHSCSTAICTPSSVSIEYISIGGLLYLLCIADNQKEFYSEMIAKEYAYPFNEFGLHGSISSEKMFKNHCEVLDGNQANRILDIFRYI